MTGQDNDYLQQIEALKAAYSEGLPNKLRDIEFVTNKVLNGDGDRDETHTAYRLAHSLAGSSGIYGFASVAECARELEYEVKPLAEASRQPTDQERHAISSLLTRLREAINAALKH